MSVARIGPKALLSLCHEVDELSEKLREFSTFGLRHLDVRRQRVIRRIKTALHRPKKDAFQARLRKLKIEHSLTETEVLVLLLLFNRRVRRTQPTCAGRDLVEAVAKDARDIIDTARILHPEAPLLASGLVTSDASGAEDSLDGGFRIADRAFRALYRAYHDLPEGGPDLGAPTGYSNATQHLLDLCALSDLGKLRAARLFPMSAWTDWVSDDGRDLDEIATRIDRLRQFVRARERATPESVRLPIVALREAHRLTDADEMIVATLLQHELFAARTTFELTELARLAATSEADVIAARARVAPDGPLRAGGILAVDDEPAGKDAFAAAWLPQAVAERLLGALDPKGVIGKSDAASFRRYLDGLTSSDDFYRQL